MNEPRPTRAVRARPATESQSGEQRSGEPRAGLSHAERARTLVAGASQLRVGVANLTHEIDRHAVGSDGSVLFLAPEDSPGAVFRVAPRLPAQVVTLTVTDVAHVPQRDRVRGTLRLTGPTRPAVEPVPPGVLEHLVGPDPQGLVGAGPVLCLQPTRVTLTWRCEAATAPDAIDQRGVSVEVPVEAYRSAAPDPMVELEGQWLPHLLHDHPQLLRSLAAHHEPGLDGSVDVRPLALDRFGVVLRLYAAGRHVDRRIAFEQPVACGCDLRPAFSALLERAAPHQRRQSR